MNASKVPGRLGTNIPDGGDAANVKVKVVINKGVLHICMFAMQDIDVGSPILLPYGGTVVCRDAKVIIVFYICIQYYCMIHFRTVTMMSNRVIQVLVSPFGCGCQLFRKKHRRCKVQRY